MVSGCFSRTCWEASMTCQDCSCIWLQLHVQGKTGFFCPHHQSHQAPLFGKLKAEIPSSNNTREDSIMDITGWSTLKSDWLYSLQPKMQKLYTVCKNKTGGWLWLRSWTPYCQLKLKKVGKTTRPFKYDLNQILYDYTVEVRNRFKGLDLIDRVPQELWTEISDIV